MGAVTVANKDYGSSPRGKVVEADVTFSASYATGGDSIALTLLGLRGVREVVVPSHNIRTRKAVADAASQAGKTVQLGGTETVPLLKLYETALTQVANATNTSTVVLRLRFIGY